MTVILKVGAVVVAVITTTILNTTIAIRKIIMIKNNEHENNNNDHDNGSNINDNANTHDTDAYKIESIDGNNY